MSNSSMKFGRVSGDVMLSSLSLESKGLFGIIAVMCGNKGHCFPKVSTLMKHAHRSRPTVHRLLKELVEAGVILRVLDPQSGMTMTVNLMDPRHHDGMTQ